MIADAYTRIAQRLAGLSIADREWVLAQLAPDDCSRVSAALRDQRTQAPPATSDSQSGPSRAQGHDIHAREAPSGGPIEGPIARLATASPAEVAQLLGTQPDWAIALVLGTDSWAWTQDFLSALAPERIRALRALALELSGTKPKVREAVVSALASKLTPREPASAVTSAFDAALDRATGELAAGELAADGLAADGLAAGGLAMSRR